MKHIFEHNGVLLQCDVTPPTGDGQSTINSVYVLGKDYLPTGPDLTALLDDMVLMRSATDAEPFLNALLAEMPA